ncbi:MAG: type II toxin-antitoxin system PemK/MazF family toxin [Chloroflexi bacterium]|nr:type II toxin-antitoxin system PemK/MazF family toxin [Chloroflexota bacterium]
MFRGEIWMMSLLPTLTPHRELNMTGDGKTNQRPVVILSSDAMGSLPLRIVVPLTPWKTTYASAAWMVYIPPVLNSGFEIPMAADTLQIRSVSNSRLVERIGDLPSSLVLEITAAVNLILEGKNRR